MPKPPTSPATPRPEIPQAVIRAYCAAVLAAIRRLAEANKKEAA